MRGGVPQHEGSRRRWLGNVLLLITALGIGLVVGEISVRIAVGDRLVRFPRYHVAARYGDFQIRRLRPNSRFVHTSADGSWIFRINAQGFRADQDYEYEPPADILRVLVLGDSQTEGFEVRQGHTYSAVMQRYLEQHGISAEVINAGVSGFGTAEEYVFLREEGYKYQPDFVVLGFYANDFQDNVKSDLFRLGTDGPVVHKYSHLPGVRILELHDAIPPARWLNQRSALYALMLNTVWDMAKRALYAGSVRQLAEEYAVPIGEVGVYEEELTLKLVERIGQFAQENGIGFILLDIPQIAADGFAPSVPPRLEEQFGRASGTYVSSQEALDGYVDTAEIFVPRGQHHISEMTHLLIGKAAAKEVAARSERAAE